MDSVARFEKDNGRVFVRWRRDARTSVDFGNLPSFDGDAKEPRYLSTEEFNKLSPKERSEYLERLLKYVQQKHGQASPPPDKSSKT
jgi:hypothetical protein